MKICILSTDQEQDDQRLLEAARAKGHDAVRYNIQDISLELSTHKPTIYWRDKDITHMFDAVIPRLNFSLSDYGTNVLQQFICSRTFVSECPDALRLGRDKLKCMQYLLASELPFPTTGIAYTPEGFHKLADQMGCPLVIKLIDSTEGVGVFVADNVKEVDNFVKTFSRFGASYVIQEFVKEAAGTDVRAFVIDGKVAASMCRHSVDDDFRANVSLGGHSEACELTDEEESMVLASAKAIGINVAGVDFVRSKDGPLLLEINVSPDFTGTHGIENITGVDIAGAIIDFTVESANQAQPSENAAQTLASRGVSLCVGG